MSRPSYPAYVADYHVPRAGDPEQEEDDAEITAAEIARFLAELTETRGLNKRQQGHIEWQQDVSKSSHASSRLSRLTLATNATTAPLCAMNCARLSKRLTMLPTFWLASGSNVSGVVWSWRAFRCTAIDLPSCWTIPPISSPPRSLPLPPSMSPALHLLLFSPALIANELRCPRFALSSPCRRLIQRSLCRPEPHQVMPVRDFLWGAGL